MFLYNYNLYFVPSFTGNSLLNCGHESIACAKPNPSAGKSQINMPIHIELEHKIFLSEDMPSPNPESNLKCEPSYVFFFVGIVFPLLIPLK